MNHRHLAGAAAVTAGLATVGGPFGMVGGLVVILIVGVVIGVVIGWAARTEGR